MFEVPSVPDIDQAVRDGVIPLDVGEGFQRRLIWFPDFKGWTLNQLYGFMRERIDADKQRAAVDPTLVRTAGVSGNGWRVTWWELIPDWQSEKTHTTAVQGSLFVFGCDGYKKFVPWEVQKRRDAEVQAFNRIHGRKMLKIDEYWMWFVKWVIYPAIALAVIIGIIVLV